MCRHAVAACRRGQQDLAYASHGLWRVTAQAGRRSGTIVEMCPGVDPAQGD